MLKEFIGKIEEKELQVYGIRVMQDGKLSAGHDFVPLTRHPIYSATKSFTSTAVGIAMEETELSLDDSVLKYMEEDLPSDCPAEIRKGLENLTIKRLLTMSVAGYPFRPEGNDWLQYSLSMPINLEKKGFYYSNIPAYLVGVIVEKAIRQNLGEYLKQRLFEPLRITDPGYSICQRGHFYGASGMKLNVEELAKLGQLYLQNGFLNGRQILSSKWVKEATDKQIETREGGYGFFFWRCPEDGYRISGKWGQRCYVFPNKKLVITYLGNLKEDRDSEYVTECMYETIIHRM